MNGLFELQKAMYKALTRDETLMAMVSGVFSHVPEHTAFPYVVIGEGMAKDHSTKTVKIEEVTSVIFVFSRERGSRNALDIMARVKELLDGAALGLNGYWLVYLRFTATEITQVREILTWQGTVTFQALVEEA